MRRFRRVSESLAVFETRDVSGLPLNIGRSVSCDEGGQLRGSSSLVSLVVFVKRLECDG